MKKITIICQLTDECADKFRKAMHGLIARLHCPASVELTKDGAIILAETNDSIARRCEKLN